MYIGDDADCRHWGMLEPQGDEAQRFHIEEQVRAPDVGQEAVEGHSRRKSNHLALGIDRAA